MSDPKVWGKAKGCFKSVTVDLVTANPVVSKVHKLIMLSEGMPDDKMFARQVRRKFV